MSNINVSYGQIEQAAAQLGSGRDEISGRLDSMHQQIQHLVSSGFVTDHASVKFSAAFDEYTVSAKIVVDKLSEIQQFLMQTSSALQEMDAHIAARIA